MKRNILVGILLILCLFCLTACGGPTWQEKYDLGMRYLDEGNYEEAIIAFNAAIEIDPKQEDIYLALKDVYIAQGDTKKAIEILEQAIAVIGETNTLCEAKDLLEQSVLQERQDTVQELITEYEPEVEVVPEVKQETEPHTEIKEEVLPLPLPESEPEPEPEHPEELIKVETDTSLNAEANEETNVPVQEQMRTEQTDNSDGTYYIKTYNSNNEMVAWSYYSANGEVIIDYIAKSGNHLSYNVYEAGNYIWVYEYDHAENMLRNNRYGLDGSPMWVYEYEYDSSGNVTRWIYYGRTGETILDYQAEEGCYLTHGQNANYIWVREYKSDGTELRFVRYTLDGALIGEN